MRHETLYVLFTCLVQHMLCSRMLSSRRHESSGRLYQPVEPIHKECGKRDDEIAISNTLQSQHAELTADSSNRLRNPFTMCEPIQPEVRLQQSVSSTLKLCALGKLAKNGNFFVSEDGTVLTKRVAKLEALELREWAALVSSSSNPMSISEYTGGCSGFGHTLLVPIVMDFEHEAHQYVVMPNLTHYYARAAPKDWIVRARYDAKPLPNLGEGLVDLVRDLRNDWGRDLQNLKEWEAWNEVRSQLSTDLQFLKDRVVDYSLFVHVIQRQGDEHDIVNVPAELSPKKGCVIDPARKTIVCFRILDFLTPFTWKRELESQYKASKFDDYAAKYLLAFDCIGDLSVKECRNYKAAAKITDAMEVSKAMAKAVFIGVKAFPVSYTCTLQTPRLHLKRQANYITYHGKRRYAGHSWEKKVVFRDAGPQHSAARWLQTAASQKAGTGYIKDFCDCGQQNCTDLECTKIILKYVNAQQPEDERPAGADYSDLDECAKMVNTFSTEGYMTTADPGRVMHNVLWAPDLNSIIAVRGLPKTHYEHKAVLEKGIFNKCFLRMEYFRCTPEDSQGVYFNYKQHFGTLEVMMLSADEFTGDERAYANAVHWGFN